ncbi:MAG: hypothetical protein QM733_14455 [Ilumatobacteraceae bacterium]
MTAPDDTPAARLERWLARDREIGAQAELDELRLRLVARDREIADLRARLDRLSNDLVQARCRPSVESSGAAPFARRVRSLAGRVLRG